MVCILCNLTGEHSCSILMDESNSTTSGFVVSPKEGNRSGMGKGIATHSYALSKHGIVGLSKNLAAELGQYGIRVNCISPWGLVTGMTPKHGATPEQIEAGLHELANLKGKVLRVEDVAKAALYLASDDGGYVSGQNLVLDGGFSVVNPSVLKAARLFQPGSITLCKKSGTALGYKALYMEEHNVLRSMQNGFYVFDTKGFDYERLVESNEELSKWMNRGVHHNPLCLRSGDNMLLSKDEEIEIPLSRSFASKYAKRRVNCVMMVADVAEIHKALRASGVNPLEALNRLFHSPTLRNCISALSRSQINYEYNNLRLSLQSDDKRNAA
ncbi:hypothetical protein RJ640_015827 [Escallonia rubra]|uniref:Uncharacterized protein n=1 Tax=Escallonia rubra TaxID=112253 RepID=A0AA88RGK3_9ASTE|nr:hypothetical protein RJ640_015827 [Escallonia rubra]